MPDRRGLAAIAVLLAASFILAQTGPWELGGWSSLLPWCVLIALPVVGFARFVVDADRALTRAARRQ